MTVPKSANILSQGPDLRKQNRNKTETRGFENTSQHSEHAKDRPSDLKKKEEQYQNILEKFQKVKECKHYTHQSTNNYFIAKSKNSESQEPSSPVKSPVDPNPYKRK